MRTIIKLVKFMPCLPVAMQDGVINVLKEAGLTIEDAEVKRVATNSADKFELMEGERACVHYVSTRDVDREGEIVMPDGINLKEFLKNPIVLWGHNYSEPPIGSDTAIESDGYGLKAKSVYATTQRGQECWTLRKEGHLRTSSIGFIPLESINSNDAGFVKMLDKLCDEHPATMRARDRVTRITRRSLLLEHSDVSVPCNPNALTLAVAKSLGLSADMIKQLKIEDSPDPVAAPPPALVTPIVIFAPTIHVRSIRVCQEETLKEKIQFALDMATGKV